MKKVEILIIILFAGAAALAQPSPLHIPLEIQKAYENGTRDTSGKPGEAYWHNTADYTIEAAIDPETRRVSGKETVTYFNNSPDDLSSIVIRLYHDVFKKGNQRGMAVNPADINDGVEVKNLVVEGMEYDLSNPQMVQRSGTNLNIALPKPLISGGKITFSMEWSYTIPLTVRRTGAKDESSFFVAYWYPQVAVYDDVFGWDRINYTFSTEFYNNLGNFDVKLTAPKNFLVWSTGVLQNAREILPSDLLNKYNQAKTSTETVHVVDSLQLTSLELKSGTWHYKASEVSDFAFAMSDHYRWDAAAQTVEGKEVLISTAFPTEDGPAYANVTAIQQKTMKHFSEDVPGIPYPYPAFTTFIGLNGGGMEFPMMANNAGPGRGVTIHELFHTYFPMYVRVNERRFAWMDEGWADFVTSLVTHKFFTEDASDPEFYNDFVAGVGSTAGTIGDLPTVTSSQYMAENYGYHSYPLPAFTYAILYHHLGEEMFLKAFREYIRRWAKKSPTPYDYFYTFEDVSGQDLSWLWNSWYFNFGYSDVKIKEVKGSKLNLEMTGGRPVPLFVKIEYKDGNVEWVERSAKAWTENENNLSITIPSMKKVESILVNGNIVDVDMFDNFYPSLDQMYREMEGVEEVLGSYKAIQFPVTVVMETEKGALRFRIPEAGLSSWLLPKEGGGYVSIDGMMEVTFSDDKPDTLELLLKNFGVRLEAKK